MRIVGSNSNRAVPCIPCHVSADCYIPDNRNMEMIYSTFMLFSYHPIIFSSFCSFSIFSSPPSFVPCSFPFRISHYSVTLHPFCLLCDQNCQRFSDRLHLHIRNANLRLSWRQHARTLKDALRICNDNSLVTICTPILGATLPVEWFWITELTDGIQQPAYGKCRHEINH